VKIIGKSDDEFANLAKSLGKSADELADDLFKKIGKNDDVNSKNIKVAIQNLDVGGDATKKAARKAFAESIDTTVDAKYFTWTQAAQAAGATGGFSATVYSALSGANKAEQSNATPRKITKVEYYQDNKDSIQQYKKGHYTDNKDKIIEKVKEYYESNKVKVLERQNKKYDCVCGKTYSYSNKYYHLKTIKHCQFIKSQDKLIQ
jgi:hypothetical protein